MRQSAQVPLCWIKLRQCAQADFLVVGGQGDLGCCFSWLLVLTACFGLGVVEGARGERNERAAVDKPVGLTGGKGQLVGLICVRIVRGFGRRGWC